MVGEELGGGEDVAEIVADLGDGGAKLGEALFLFKGARELYLHRGERHLGVADFGDAGGWSEDGAGVFGMGGIALHIADHAPDRFHEEHPHGEEEEGGGDD